MKRGPTLVLALAAIACQGGGRSAQPEPSHEEEPSPPAPTVGVPPSDPEPAAEACTPGQPISPSVLAASWPSRLGARVSFRGHVDVALDMMTAIEIAGGHRFVVVASADRLWQGDIDRTYAVMGSRTVSLYGRTTLPQLLLEPECSP